MGRSRSEIASLGGLAAAANLDPKSRKKRSKKAASASAGKRRKAIEDRNQGIVAAYRYLTGQPMRKKSEATEGLSFLIECGWGVNLPEGVGARRFLAWATGLTKRRISAIISQSEYR
jgi:hypothetical protein